MTERDENIICGVIVASFLDAQEKERLCALVRLPAADTPRHWRGETCPDGDAHVLRCIRCELPGTGVAAADTATQTPTCMNCGVDIHLFHQCFPKLKEAHEDTTHAGVVAHDAASDSWRHTGSDGRNDSGTTPAPMTAADTATQPGQKD